ncbi:hypothetical protein LOAG_09053 [Loa loa]|uniref:Uncharacterized protein n=1 Tax=Loa loa TaxID=7209 RepID=A0A1S0TT50_LOALO|nr:hypothetical protein LOAG_09053 [Loa loa]EFO19442.1 hypothetical protein LOAG_09053 [Loa loa]
MSSEQTGLEKSVPRARLFVDRVPYKLAFQIEAFTMWMQREHGYHVQNFVSYNISIDACSACFELTISSKNSSNFQELSALSINPHHGIDHLDPPPPSNMN